MFGLVACSVILAVLGAPSLGATREGYRLYGRCRVPLADRILASSRSAVVFRQGPPDIRPPAGSASASVYGCLRPVGRTRLLESVGGDIDNFYFISSAFLNGSYAALVYGWEDQHYGGEWSTVHVFDLRTGRRAGFGGEKVNCLSEVLTQGHPGCENQGPDRVVLGTDGISARGVTFHCSTGIPCQAMDQEIIASDATGAHTVDSGAFANREAGLTSLKLSGDLLSWDDEGSPRRIGLTARRINYCVVPIDAKILATSSQAVVYREGSENLFPRGYASASFYGCLRALGRTRFLETLSGDIDSFFFSKSAVVQAPYAALVESWENSHYGGQFEKLQVFNLNSGESVFGGENTAKWCGSTGVAVAPVGCRAGGFDKVILGNDGVSAVHIRYPCDGAIPCYTYEQIQAADATGTHTLDSGNFPGNGHYLVNLKLTGDVLAWDHEGTPHSVVLKR